MEVILSYQEDKPYRISVTLIEIGEGLVAIVEGGTRPHIGSVAIAIPRPGLKDPDRMGSTVSVYNVLGHKDDRISTPLADLIARSLKRVTIVLAGIHVEGAREEDISGILDQMEEINNKIVTMLSEKNG